ncbi:subtilisin-like serine protease [Pochonia chlamydosporia 170]|uniref:Subtilisin-like serine protease n=1 Tax=Pochonia chlamydosporia 170 TaxID=1380566 RepID=A0A179EYZ7_METCM|nr:subtilisin-like serine protease [Pochonia chlamydosporia 170]OAQ58425.1 subtilisin-like serine protease [Pochonia chlamydosporia 170]
MAGDSRNGSRMGRRPSPPFSVRLLEHKDEQGPDASRCERNWLQSLLPASYRTESDDLAAPARHVQTCIENELDLRRLTTIHGWLWLAGRPMPPRPLHYQLLVGRKITITEQMDMHLVWMTGHIFLKPMPRFLLEPQFWHEYLSCGQECECSDADAGFHGTAYACGPTVLARRALGFLFSYAALISHESDFLIAKDKRLLPTEVRWPSWRVFVEELHTEYIYPSIDSRFYYGELRLSRLNKIYYLWWTPLRGYKPRWDQYGVFFRENFAWLAAATVYIAVVLAAMRVGLATKSLASNDAFQSASYGFTVFSILGPLVVAGLIILAFCYTFVYSWVVTFRYRKRRLQNISGHSR